jgi:methionyl-tRNA formyltransferase
MKVVVFAYHEIGYVCLEELVNFGADILCLFTHQDDPGEKIWFRKPVTIAEKHNIPVYTPENLKDASWVELLKSLSPDFIFSFYYRNMIPKEILGIPKVGAFNLHGSLLPKFRGRAPVNWVLIAGEKRTGVTLHYMLEKPDAGDMIAQKECEITFDDTAYTLFMKMADAAKGLMREALPRFRDGTFTSTPQTGQSSYLGGRKPEDGLIAWEKDALSIYNLTRAVTHPYPGAFTYFDDRKLYVWKAYPDDDGVGAHPGEVVSAAPLTVGTGKGLLKLMMVQLEGEDEMDGEQFARRHNLENKTLGGHV